MYTPWQTRLLTDAPSAPKLDLFAWGCALVTSGSTFLCMETLSLYRLNTESSAVGLVASCTASVHLLCCTALFVTCCCACDASSVHIRQMSEPGATAHAQRHSPPALHGAPVASQEHECRPCDKHVQTDPVTLHKPISKALIPLWIPARQAPTPWGPLAVSPFLNAYSLSGQSEATRQMVRMTVLLI